MVGTALRAFAHPTINCKEAVMRTLAGLTVTLAALVGGPAQAQTYDPAWPVCMQVYSKGANFITCGYTSLEQCRATASGRSAMCMLNPYYAGPGERPRRRHRSNG
jgi:hypothetical protein